MLATMSEDPEEISQAVINTLNDHIKTEGIKAEELPQAEAELLLLWMRAKSVGETVKITVTDPDEPSVTYPVSVKLTDIKVDIDEKFSDQAVLDDGTILKMKLPGITALDGVGEESNEFDSTLMVLANCVKCIIMGEEATMAKDMEMEEIFNFLLDLSSGEFQRLSDSFVTRMPKLHTMVSVTRKDGSKLEVPVNGLASFL